MTWILWLYATIGALAILAVGFHCAVEAWYRYRAIPTQDDSVRFVRRCLSADAKWFSEHPPTMRVLERLSQGHRVDDVREEWRRARRLLNDVRTAADYDLAAPAARPERSGETP